MEESFWRKIIKSFNPKFFKEIAPQPLRRSFKYLLFLLLLLALLLSFKYTIGFSGGVKEIARNLPIFFEKLRDIPEIIIEKGKVTSPKQVFIKEWEKSVFVIDPQGELSYYLALIENYKVGGLVILKDKIIVKSEEGKIEIYDLPEKISYLNLKFNERGKERLFSLTLDRKVFQPTFTEINHWLNIVSFIFFPLCFIFIFFGLWIGKLIQIFVLSLLSLIVNKVKKIGLHYQSLLNIGIFALTLPVILETLVKLSGLEIPFFGFIYYGLYLVFLILGILACKETKTAPIEKLE